MDTVGVVHPFTEHPPVVTVEQLTPGSRWLVALPARHGGGRMTVECEVVTQPGRGLVTVRPVDPRAELLIKNPGQDHTVRLASVECRPEDKAAADAEYERRVSEAQKRHAELLARVEHAVTNLNDALRRFLPDGRRATGGVLDGRVHPGDMPSLGNPNGSWHRIEWRATLYLRPDETEQVLARLARLAEVLDNASA